MEYESDLEATVDGEGAQSCAVADRESAPYADDPVVLLNGREILFSEAVGELRPYVRHTLTNAFGSMAELDDVTNDALLLVWKNRHQYNGKAKLTTWVYRIACNAAVSHRRAVLRQREKRDRLKEVVRDRHPQEYFTFRRRPEEIVDLIGEEVRKERGTLDYEIFASRAQGIKYSEISARLGVPCSTIKGRLHRIQQWCKSQDFLRTFCYAL